MIITLTILAILIQGYLIFRIIKQYLVFRYRSINTDDIDLLHDESTDVFDIDDSDDISEDKIELFSNLRWNVGKSGGLEFVENTIQNYYALTLQTISHFGNLGPASGLIFTFAGMMLTFFEINTSNIADQGHVKTIVLSMSPVIVGSLLGIVTYAISKIAENEISKQIDGNVTEITKAIKTYDENVIPENIEDAYEKILISLTNLKGELKGVTKNISEYSQTMGKSNKVFEESVRDIGRTSSTLVKDFNDSKETILGSSTELLEKFNTYSTSLDSANMQITELFNTQKASTDLMQNLMVHGISFTESVKLSGKAMSQLMDTVDNQNKASENLMAAADSFNKIQNELVKVTLDIKAIHETSQSVAENINTISEMFPVNTFNDMRMHLQSISGSIEGLGSTLIENQKEMLAEQKQMLADQINRSDKKSQNTLGNGDMKGIENLLQKQLLASTRLYTEMIEKQKRGNLYRKIFYPISLVAIVLAIVLSLRFDDLFATEDGDQAKIDSVSSTPAETGYQGKTVSLSSAPVKTSTTSDSLLEEE